MARPAAQRREMVIIRPGERKLSYADSSHNRVTESSTLGQNRQRQLAWINVCLGRVLIKTDLWPRAPAW